MRVIMSAIGSVICYLSSKPQVPNPPSQHPNSQVPLRFEIWRLESGMSPTALRDARDIALERQLAEAQTAHVELAHVGARPATQVAAVAMANLVLERLFFFGDLCCCSHQSLL